MIKLLRPGLTALCLLLLASCSSPPAPIIVTRTKVIPRLPPENLLRPCPIPEPTGPLVKNEAMSQHILQLYAVIDRCNTDKTDLASWAAKQKEAGDGNPKQ